MINLMLPEIISENAQYWVINKPAGMATEPPSRSLTLRDWLIEQGRIKPGEWDENDRAGIVHRLDTDTSGVIIWAKNHAAQKHLRELWQGRAVRKNYLALVTGNAPDQGIIEASLMRDNKKDRQVAALFPHPKARPAITEYERLAVGEWEGNKVSLIRAHPITGRTHQIRVHLKSIGHPIIGDSLYGEKSGDAIAKGLHLNRQFLHAESIELEGNSYSVELPKELADCLKQVNISL
ncbi:MAG: RluA family pseudouridine synthase [Patescibacteria group bacterium]